MLTKKTLLALTLTVGASVAYAAPSPVGSWSGHLHLMPSSSMTPAQKQKFDHAMQRTSSIKISLTLNKDHTFAASTKGAPSAQNQTGKWSQSGNTVTLNGGKGGGQSFTLAPNGKTMTFHMPSGGPVKGEVVFTR